MTGLPLRVNPQRILLFNVAAVEILECCLTLLDVHLVENHPVNTKTIALRYYIIITVRALAFPFIITMSLLTFDRFFAVYSNIRYMDSWLYRHKQKCIIFGWCCCMAFITITIFVSEIKPAILITMFDVVRKITAVMYIVVMIQFLAVYGYLVVVVRRLRDHHRSIDNFKILTPFLIVLTFVFLRAIPYSVLTFAGEGVSRSILFYYSIGRILNVILDPLVYIFILSNVRSKLKFKRNAISSKVPDLVCQSILQLRSINNPVHSRDRRCSTNPETIETKFDENIKVICQ